MVIVNVENFIISLELENFITSLMWKLNLTQVNLTDDF